MFVVSSYHLNPGIKKSGQELKRTSRRKCEIEMSSKGPPAFDRIKNHDLIILTVILIMMTQL